MGRLTAGVSAFFFLGGFGLEEGLEGRGLLLGLVLGHGGWRRLAAAGGSESAF
jgi:hypothetical protein